MLKYSNSQLGSDYIATGVAISQEIHHKIYLSN
jgi:hypothetical protein